MCSLAGCEKRASLRESGAEDDRLARDIPVARELAPAGARSGPKMGASVLPGTQLLDGLRLLRSRAGASSLATRVLHSV